MRKRTKAVLLPLIVVILLACNSLEICTRKCSSPGRTDDQVETCIKECLGTEETK